MSSEEDFQYWLAHMDDALEAFRARLLPEVSDLFDDSPGREHAKEMYMADVQVTSRSTADDLAGPFLTEA